MEFAEYKDSIVTYLKREKADKEREISVHKEMSIKDKIDNGLLVPHAKIVKAAQPCYTLQVEENYSRLRPGDKVWLHDLKADKMLFDIIVLENKESEIEIECGKKLDGDTDYDIIVDEQVLMDPLIKAVEKIEAFSSGAGFLNTLSGTPPPISSLRGGLSEFAEDFIPENFNDKQRAACQTAFRRPTLLCIQGTPGSGKTQLLSIIAQAYSNESKEVLVISLTHQAVNNALNKIHEMDGKLPVFKIGDAYRSEGISKGVQIAETYGKYQEARKNKKKKVGAPGDILGMTLHAATVNLGLRTTGYQPVVVLVDEAGQIPLAHASVIGAFGCGSVIFIGDHEQMPPIYSDSLENDPLSVSIFEHLVRHYPEKTITLNTTYRMNEEITALCSRNFYEPHGVHLISSDSSKNRFLHIPLLEEKGWKGSVVYITDSPHNDYSMEMNAEEAKTAAELVKALYEQGLSHEDVAVVTPFRLQVRTIRECVADVLPPGSPLPLIDTVERLQGQDVECVIISFSVSDPSYLKSMKSFLFQPNRLNVMISRAKSKVIFLASEAVMDVWGKINKHITRII